MHTTSHKWPQHLHHPTPPEGIVWMEAHVTHISHTVDGHAQKLEEGPSDPLPCNLRQPAPVVCNSMNTHKHRPRQMDVSHVRTTHATRTRPIPTHPLLSVCH